MTTRLTLKPVNANVVAVHQSDGLHVGNLKHIGSFWKFKAVGYGSDGAVEPGGGPLTLQHNALFDEPEEVEVNQRLAPHL